MEAGEHVDLEDDYDFVPLSAVETSPEQHEEEEEEAEEEIEGGVRAERDPALGDDGVRGYKHQVRGVGGR